MEVGDLVQRVGTPEWRAIITEVLKHGRVEVFWLDIRERNTCSQLLLELISESR